jgi:hypothetical protein
MRISIRHQLRFDLGQGISHAVQQLLLTAQSGPTQTVADWTIDMDGIQTAARYDDAFGNVMHLVSQTRPEGEKLVTVTGTVETHDRNGVLGRIAGEPVPALFKRNTELARAPEGIAEKFRERSRLPGQRIGVLHAIMTHIGELFAFGEDKAEDPEEVQEGQSQSQSQDGQSQSQGGAEQSQGEEADAALPRPQASAEEFTHMFIGVARALDIPARYVTGYLVATEDSKPEFHAWAEAYDDALGWIGFDVALGYCPTDQHVRLAVGLDAMSTTPLRSVPKLGVPELVEVVVVEAAQ